MMGFFLLLLQERQQPGERRDQNFPQQSQDLSGNRRPSYRYSAALSVAFLHSSYSLLNSSKDTCQMRLIRRKDRL